MKSVMQHNFSTVPKAQIQRSSFNRSHGYKTTFNGGFLIPFFVDEALPGDTFNLKVNCFARLASCIVPFMDNLFLDTFFFFVPNRLVWDHWEQFNGQQANPGDSTDYVVPISTAPSGGYAVGSLQDYMGLPTGVAGYEHNTLHLRAYNLIWNEWFRDQNLQDSRPVDTGDGPDDVTNYVINYRGKRHDYFTSALPWPQKGPAVDLPLGTSAPVVTANPGGPNPAAIMRDSATGSAGAAGAMAVGTGGVPTNPGLQGLYLDPNSSLVTDLTGATAATINQLRQAFQIQRMYERDARGGTRYTEIIKSHFGVTSPDARLQRPEYLGGGSTPIKINPVVQTSGTGATGTTTPQANLAAYGLVATGQQGFTKSFVEHGVIIGLMSVRADLSYQSGLNKMWSRQTRFDYYWPALSHLGEQAVLNSEIYTQGNSTDAEVFGYQERYAEYRYYPSMITGLFRSQASDSLDVWHLAQAFGSLPALNAAFITDPADTVLDRIVAVDDEPQFLFDSYFSMTCARPMPVYGVPGLIDHF